VGVLGVFRVFRVFGVSTFVFTCRLQAADLDRSRDSGSDPAAGAQSPEPAAI